MKCLCSNIAMTKRDDWSELPCRTQPFKTVAQKYSPNGNSIILLTEEEIFTIDHTERPAEWPTAYPSNKKKDVAHTINVQTLMASVCKSQVVDITPVWYLPITESRLVESINRNVMLLQQFHVTPRAIESSSSSFSRTVPWRTGCFSPFTAKSVGERILKIGQHFGKVRDKNRMNLFSEHDVYICNAPKSRVLRSNLKKILRVIGVCGLCHNPW